MEGCGLLFRNVGPETKALGFSMQSISRLCGPVRQDDELVIDNQGFWRGRRCEELPENRANRTSAPDEGLSCRIAVIPPCEPIATVTIQACSDSAMEFHAAALRAIICVRRKLSPSPGVF
jgi:hypothetical protein